MSKESADAKIVVIAGGVGAARFLRGLVEVHDPARITAIVNVADDFVVHGLYICPDLDTVRSTLVDDVGDLGWGRANETWTVMNELRTLSAHAPEHSRATDWFSLGDRDLAIHLYRTQRMREGATLDEVTNELCAETGVRSRLLPATNDIVQTRVILAGGNEVDFQEYFVGLRHDVAIEKIEFSGIDDARPAPGVLDAIDEADKIVIAPSNPFVSIAPVTGIGAIGDELRRCRDKVVAISPIVDGRAIKGPAGKMFDELGHRSSVESVSQLWQPFVTRLFIDTSDAGRADAVSETGVEPIVVPTIMSDIGHSSRLAQAVLTG